MKVSFVTTEAESHLSFAKHPPLILCLLLLGSLLRQRRCCLQRHWKVPSGLRGHLQHRLAMVLGLLSSGFSPPPPSRTRFYSVTYTQGRQSWEKGYVSLFQCCRYRKAREGRAVHLDESLVAESVAAMRIYIDSETKT
jgi:hypothetical protein